ncbi:SDR family oxidoreductase [Billgrantia tianxiuensis]|jgi:NAD(P)-dependent dehydrogenase (short-subunit alcohol dehydrogenase family)|uniref:SDR family oxidoreductase n=1 Tax=Billgrantia tianxiuensis TaxID=2497861 RepID=A0A6I6SRT9_9GAMM|nr:MULTISPECIES: SDR family oxidoreductase [Halomonas]MCE8032687.1 SDR family oxidoreductase [Halomonas sp. MCCC 1A11057]QHC49403.1 SDR family oxidoreductase [Halomonas tianxiuensis]
MNSDVARYPSLDQRVVFITGGGSGIGAALTRAFHLQGARVAFVDIDDASSQALVEQLNAETGWAPRYWRCDIRDVEALQGVIAEVGRELGPIHTLVNNAANDDRHTWQEVDVAYWDERMSLNLRPMFFAAQAAAHQMIEAGGGSIVNFGSISVQMAIPELSTYVTAKAAVHGLTRSLARDLGRYNIRVNTLVPGSILTERQLQKWIGPEEEASIQAHQCLKLRLKPEHVAPTVLFLAADDSTQLTGAAIPVDGGWG